MDFFILIKKETHGAYPFENESNENAFIGTTDQSCVDYAEKEIESFWGRLVIEHWVINSDAGIVKYISSREL